MRFGITAIILLLALPSFAQTGALKITLEGIEDMKGKVAVAIYDVPENFLKKDYQNTYQRLENSDVYIMFDKLPAGIYAVSLFHDVNSNKKLDTNFFGLPTEAYGFGNNARGIFGPPSFKNSSIEVMPGKITKIVVGVR